MTLTLATQPPPVCISMHVYACPLHKHPPLPCPPSPPLPPPDHYPQPKLLKEVETEVLTNYEQNLLQKEHSGCAALLKDDKVGVGGYVV